MAANMIVTESDYDPNYLKHIIKSTPHLRAQFREILGECGGITTQVHPPAGVGSNGDFGIFYRYFFTKYISIRLGQDARSGMVNKHAAIFPFKTNPDLQTDPVPVAELFDGEFLRVMKEFVEYHFGDRDFEQLKNLLLANVDHFKRQHFSNSPSVEQLIRITSIGSVAWRQDQPPEYLSDYLVDFIRLNNAGVEWYMNFQAKFEQICQLYDQEYLIRHKSMPYFQYLPEINCCELLLLLETEFFQTNRSKYTSLFRKYLFFFGNAISSPDHAVFFIDETLFICLQYKKKYEESRGNILHLQWELWMMTLVHRRKHRHRKNPLRQPPPQKSHNPNYLRLDQNNLRHVISYADEILRGVESASVYYGEAEYPRSKVFLLLDHSVLLTSFHKNNHEHIAGQVLKSALLHREIETLVYYNACSGKQTTHEMPARKNEIRRFIGELTEQYGPQPRYPEKFLIRDMPYYFVNHPIVAQQND